MRIVGLSLLVIGLLTLLGCPAKPGSDPTTTDTSKIDALAAQTLVHALQDGEANLQFTAGRYILALDPATIADTTLTSPSMREALLSRLANPATTLQTQQWLIDLLATSAFWRGLSEAEQDAALAWTETQGQAEVMEAREVAAYALFRLGQGRKLGAMVPFITDDERTVRAIAAEAFGKYGSGTEWATLKRFVIDDNEFVRLRAAKIIAQWILRHGPDLDKAKAVEQLDLLAADDDPFVRRMADQARGIGLMFDPTGYRAEIYSKLLTDREPQKEDAEWENFRNVALGQFEWSVGTNLPVPSEVSGLVFEFLWEEHPDLRRTILESVAMQPRPGSLGFLQSAWMSGDEGLQLLSLQLMREILQRDGELPENFDEVILDVGAMDLVNVETKIRAEAVRFLLTLARSRSIARFEDDQVRAWEAQTTGLFYSPRDTVRHLVTTINPRHPWLERAAKAEFEKDQRLIEKLPRLHRMAWFGTDPRTIDPTTGAIAESPQFALTADEYEQLYRWGLVPPGSIIEPELTTESAVPTMAQIRAAGLWLRGDVPLAPLEPDARGSADWADPEERKEVPSDTDWGRYT